MEKKQIEELINKYHIIAVGNNIISIPMKYAEMAKKDNMLDTIKSCKPFILDYFCEKKAQEVKAAQEREDKIRAIEGLDEIMECRADWEEWHMALEKMMDTGSGVMTVSRPSMDEEELRKKYHRADAYLLAYKEANKSNYELSAIGREALEKIINGDDYTKVIEDMKKAISDFTDRHFWD